MSFTCKSLISFSIGNPQKRFFQIFLLGAAWEGLGAVLGAVLRGPEASWTDFGAVLGHGSSMVLMSWKVSRRGLEVTGLLGSISG